MLLLLIALVLALVGIWLLLGAVVKGEFDFKRLVFGLVLLGIAIYVGMATTGG